MDPLQRQGARLALTGLLALLGACGENVSEVPHGPSYHDVLGSENAGGPSTRYLPVGETNWRSHVQNELRDDDCYDLAIAPDGVNRFLAYVQEDDDEVWRLYVRTGLGPAIWGDEHMRIDVPDPGFSPPRTCHQPRIFHLTDRKYGVVWPGNGALHTALLDLDKPIGFELALNHPFEREDFAEQFDEEGFFAAVPTVRSLDVSMALVGDEVWMAWSPPTRESIKWVRGELEENGIDFGPFSRFTPHRHTAMSDLIVVDGQPYVAVSSDGAVRLMTKPATEPRFQESQSCGGSGGVLEMLYADAGGFTVHRGGSLLRFDGCQSSNFEQGIAGPRLTHYFPGAPG